MRVSADRSDEFDPATGISFSYLTKGYDGNDLLDGFRLTPRFCLDQVDVGQVQLYAAEAVNC